MILIADSGGSKTDWRFIDKNGTISQASAPGFNPYYQPIEDLKTSVRDIVVPKTGVDVDKIYFYGAGVSSDKNQLSIKKLEMAKSKKENSFETKLNRIEEIIELLNNNKLPLEEAIQLHKEATELIKSGMEYLEKTALQFETIG